VQRFLKKIVVSISLFCISVIPTLLPNAIADKRADVNSNSGVHSTGSPSLQAPGQVKKDGSNSGKGNSGIDGDKSNPGKLKGNENANSFSQASSSSGTAKLESCDFSFDTSFETSNVNIGNSKEISQIELGNPNSGGSNNGKALDRDKDKNTKESGNDKVTGSQSKDDFFPIKKINPTGAFNVVLKNELTQLEISKLSQVGKVIHSIPQIRSLTMNLDQEQLQEIKRFEFVESVNFDAVRCAGPVTKLGELDLASGFSTWNLDQINVTNGVGESSSRVVSQKGEGVYVAVLDTGLVKNWHLYFGDSIAVEYAAAFGGGGGERGNISRQPNKWGLDQDSHGTHVTSTIIGFNWGDRVFTGVAPKAKVIPVKVLGQNGSGWSSVISEGIVYVANLKRNELKDHPVVINMSLGGPVLDAVEKEAVDYAIESGVIVIASAGNAGAKGMGYPGAYAPVISVGASGWVKEWTTDGVPANGSWWRSLDVPETGAADAYIAEFSSRQLTGTSQQLDVVAPGSWIVGPYQTNGQISWYFLGGTSMASPHVAGLVSLMLQKQANLQQSRVEEILKLSSWPIAAGSKTIVGPSGVTEVVSWGSDATGSGLIDVVRALAAVTP
jgi:subtilisin family serine protease